MSKQKSKTLVIVIICIILTGAIFAGTFLVFRPYYYENMYMAPIPANLSKPAAYQPEPIFADFYIAANGNDNAGGTAEFPYATIDRVRKDMSMLNKDMRSHVVIAFKAGTYDIETLKLTKKDSGTDKCPVIYTAYGDGEVIFRGNSSKYTLEIDGAKHITLSNITIENPGGSAVKIKGSNVDISGCKIQNTAGTGIVADGKNINITSCSISKTGLGAVELNGSNINFDNNTVYSSSVAQAETPSVIINGNKNTFTHNEIYNTPSGAVHYTGEENTIEYNYIHNAVLQSTDTAAISGEPEAEGGKNLVRYNCISTIGNGKNAPVGVAPAAGTVVRGNMFINIKGCGVFASQADNIEITNNILVNCAEPVKLDRVENTLTQANIVLHHDKKALSLPADNLVSALNETEIFIDAENGIYDIHRDNEAVMAIGFGNLPFDSMGRY